jgi:hypothetical protein
VGRRGRGFCAAAALLLAAACDSASADVKVQPLPPLARPTPERRAGLPEVAGMWRFTGFEIAPKDTGRVREDKSLLAPPGDFLIRTQRLDSLAGQYVRPGQAFDFTGEVRRDGTVAVVAIDADGAPQFASGRVVRDTFWLELTSFPTAATWPTGARAAFIRRGVIRPFTRYLGGAPIIDVYADSVRRDSIRRADSVAVAARAAAAAAAVPPVVAPGAQVPGAVVPGAVPPAGAPAPQPGAVRPTVPAQPAVRPPVQQPVARPPVQRPRPQPQPTPPPVDTNRPAPVTPPPTSPTTPPDTIVIPPRG